MIPLAIITPTLNAARTFRATLESIRPLIEAGAEHLVIDGGSDDGTADLARGAGAAVVSCPAGNIYEAINLGLGRTTAEWLTYLNADDLLYPDAIVQALGQSTGADVVYGNIDYVDEAGRFLFSWRSPPPRRLRFLMGYYNPCPQQGTLFRRRLYEKLDGFDCRFRYAADYDFWCRAAFSGAVFRKSGPLSHAAFRLSPGQLSQRCRRQMAPEGRTIRQQIRGGASTYGIGGTVASLYRWSSNADSYLLRAWRGRNLDKGWR